MQPSPPAYDALHDRRSSSDHSAMPAAPPPPPPPTLATASGELEGTAQPQAPAPAPAPAPALAPAAAIQPQPELALVMAAAGGGGGGAMETDGTRAVLEGPRPAVGGMRVNVRTLTGRTIVVMAEPNESILTFKRRLQLTPGIEVPPERQRLIFLGQELHDARLLSDNPPIGPDAVVHIVLRVDRPPVAAVAGAPMGAGPQFFVMPGMVQPNANGQMPMGYGPGGAMMPAQLVAEDAFTMAQIEVERTASHMRSFGSGLLLFGLIYFIVMAARHVWVEAGLSFCMILVGYVALRAGIVRTTRLAKAFLISVVVFILVDFGANVGTMVLDNDGSVASVVLASLLVSVLSCALCAYCGRLHLRNCVERDRVLLSLPPPLRAQLIQQVPLQRQPLAHAPDADANARLA